MKDLQDWNKQLKRFNLLVLIVTSAITTVLANNDYLSQTKKDVINYSYEKATEDSQKLKNDWINPITYKYIYSDTETYDTQKSTLSISQPIFKSGGIYYAIKYASSIRKQTNIGIDVQKKELIKQVIDLLFHIKKTDITIRKQKLLIQNAKLDIERKKEQVLNGILDTSFLDNAILDSNAKQNTLIDLEYQKITLVNNLSVLSDKKYEELEIPILSLTNKDLYLAKNIYLQKAQDETRSSYWFKNMIRANYLPTINATADYTKYHDTDDSPSLTKGGIKNYGLNLTIPLDIKYSNSIQSAKIEYLQNKISLQEKKDEEKMIFDNATSKVKSLDKKISIANNDITLYDSLVMQIKEQLDVGMKTRSDLETIQNSRKIKKLDIESLKIEKQLELLEIYSRIEI